MSLRSGRSPRCVFIFSFFFNDTATTEIYTLSLHDALPICLARINTNVAIHKTTSVFQVAIAFGQFAGDQADRKSTRLNSSHEWISYAVFCLKKKKKMNSLFCLKEQKKNIEQFG